MAARSGVAKIEAVEAEVDVENDGSIEVPLCDATVRVLPTNEWRSRAIRSMREGDYDTWAELCLAGDDYDIWTDVDPTLADVERFFEAWSEATGQDSGKSRASRRSSRSTARR